MNGVNAEFFFSLYLYTLKFDMVIVDACVDGMGGFKDSNMTHTMNSTIKRKNYNINVKGVTNKSHRVRECPKQVPQII